MDDPANGDPPADHIYGSKTRCNLTWSDNRSFQHFWADDYARNKFFSECDKVDLARLRLVNHDFAGKGERWLFRHLSVNFKTRTFSTRARMNHLERIGRHVQTFAFNMPETVETILPPLVDPATGEHLTIAYSPQVPDPSRPSSAQSVGEKQYGSTKLAQLVNEQYPPVFYAATNVPAFIRLFTYLKRLRHVIVNCPRTISTSFGRPSIVDYALISLRIAMERAPLEILNSFSIKSLHEEGLLYLQPLAALGALPDASKTWSAIDNLDVRLQCHDACDPKRTNTVKLLHAFLGQFKCMRYLRFEWLGPKGPFPLSLHNDPRLTAPMQKLEFPYLRRFWVQNTTMDAWQVSNVLYDMRKIISVCDFREVFLRSGDWDMALDPLVQMVERHNRKRARRFERRHNTEHDSMLVPIMLSPEATPRRPAPKAVIKLPKQVHFAMNPEGSGHPAYRKSVDNVCETVSFGLEPTKSRSKASRALTKVKTRVLAALARMHLVSGGERRTPHDWHD